jgi:hypothetical protein
MWLELLEGLGRIVNESEASALATTELGLEAEDGDLVLGGLVQLAQFLSELILGDIRSIGMEDIAIVCTLVRKFLEDDYYSRCQMLKT